MVREAKFSCHVDDGWIEPPVCRDSVFDDVLPLITPRSRRRRRESQRRSRHLGSEPSSATPRRNLAGADWLSVLPRSPRRAK